MTFSDYQRANDAINMKQIKSKKRGTTKDFAVVDEKIKAFKMLYPDGGINTKIMAISDGVCIAHAEITDANGHILGAGTAQKKQTDDNTDSYIEQAETAAVGRALRFCGIGLENIAAAVCPIEDPEIVHARLKMQIMSYVIRHKYTEEQIHKICERYEVNSLEDLNIDCCKHYINYIKEKGGNIDE